MAKNAYDEALAMVGKLRQQASGAFNRTAGAVGSAVKSYANTYSKVAPYVPFAPKVYTPQQMQPAARAVTEYTKNQVINPIRQGVTQAVTGKGIVNRSMGALQAVGGAYSATPVGAAYNVVSGGAAGALRSARTGQDVLKSVYQGVTQPTSIAQQGLGIKNPLLALGVDVLAGNPKGTVKSLKNIKNTVRSVRNFDVYKDDVQVVREGLDYLGSKISRTKPNLDLLGKLERDGDVLNDKLKIMGKKEWKQLSLQERYKWLGRALADHYNTPKSMGGAGGVMKMVDDKVPIGDTTSQYNVGRIKTQKPEVVKQAINEVAPEFKKVVGGPIKHKDIEQQAQIVSDDLVKTIGRAKTEELGAAQLRIRQNIARMADEGQVTPDLLQALKTDAAFARSTAQLMGQRVIDAAPSSAQGRLKTEMIKNILKVSDDLDNILKNAEGVDFNDARQASEFYRKFVKPSVGEWADKLRYNSMLSSPLTHIVNIASNAQGTAIVTPIQKTIEGVIDAAVSGVTGRARTRFAGEGPAYAKGYSRAVGQAFNNMLDTFSGKKMMDNPDMRGVPLAPKGVFSGVEKALDVPSRALEAMDQFFKTLAEGGLEEASKYRVAKGGAAINTAKEAEKMLFRNDLVEEGAGVVSRTIGAGGNWVKKATNSEVPAFRWIAKLTLPFVNIGTNLAKTGAEFNPISGAINMIGNTDKTAQASKIVMGSAVTLTGAMLALDNKITFSEPANQDDKNAARQAGIQPYSIKIGDRWYQYSKMHPLVGFQLGMVAALTDAWKQKKINENTGAVIAQGLFQSLQYTADQTYFKNIGDFVGTMKGDVEGLSKLVSNYPSQFVPYRATASWINRIIDEYQRQPDRDASFFVQAFQQFASQVPGLAQSFVPPRTDRMGNPVANKDRFVNALSPVKTTKEDPALGKQYNEVMEIKKMKRDLGEAPSSTDRVKTMKDTLKTLDPQARKDYLINGLKSGEIQKEDIKAFVADLQKQSRGLTYSDEVLLNAPIKTRATYIRKELSGKTLEVRKAYLLDLYKKKILTKDVLLEIAQPQ